MTSAREATRGDPTRAASVETDNGHGPVVAVALGSGDIWDGPMWAGSYDSKRLVVRIWEVEEAEEGEYPDELPELLLSEFIGTLVEDATEGVRLLTVEENGPDGHAVIRGTAWFDSKFEKARFDDD